MKNINTTQCVALVLLSCAMFILGVFSQFLHIFPHTHHWDEKSRQIREQSTQEKGQFSLINPLLECDIAEGMLDAYKINFKDDLDDTITQLKAVGDASVVAVYFRDLNNGPTFGISEDEEFIPASLLKVPVMMSYFFLADEDPSILEKELTLSDKENIAPDGKQIIAPKEEIIPGKPYTIKELVERSVIYSDNSAVTLLIENLDARPIRHLYDMLGVREDVLNGPTGHLTVKEYAAFFRILFNSSYLSRKNSEQALTILTKTEFDSGLRAGVPRDILVAHKFGEGGNTTEHQIHDCGIVYYPDHPYLLCIMSRGNDITKLENTIAKISDVVYKKIDAINKENN